MYVVRASGYPDFGILVEEMLDSSKYRKYNSNNGWVLGLDNAHVQAGNDEKDDLPDVIEEGDEDLDDEEQVDTKVCMHIHACM